ncbi:MAG: DUF5995 family protein [Bacteroidales bacterium]|nr:DUF5995 family protein [Bacteroidales bacterium]
MNDLPHTIDEVLERLDRIIAETVSENNYLGIFAYVYRRTTAEIKKAINGKQFDDNERMELMDVAFANKYISAYENFKHSDGPVSLSWTVPFRAAAEKLTIMQHLLMGMNAHINLDLGIAAAETAPGSAIHGLKNDFMMVNEILAGLTDEMQVRVGRISWWMFLVDWLGGKNDEAVINFSMIKAREAAWDLACQLAVLTDEERKNSNIEKTDTVISALAEIIKRPPGLLLNAALKFISKFEEKEVKRILSGLEQ